MIKKYKLLNIIIFTTTLIVLSGITVFWLKTATPCSSAPAIKCGIDGFEETYYPFLWAFSPIFLISSLLFFLRHEVFTAWVKFTAIGFPIMLGGLLYYFNIEQSTGGWIGGPTESQVASVVLPGLFLIISFILIISKSIQLKKDGKTQ